MTNQYSAVDPALGYLYQVRSALLWALQKLKLNPQFFVSIETLDDVAFEMGGGDAPELLQLKHHRRGLGNLSDRSPDLWKTIRIWVEGLREGSIPLGSNLCLVTTGVAASASVASKLRATHRDQDSALAALIAVASSSTNTKNAAGYKVFLEASDADRKALLDSLLVIDAAPSVADLEDRMRRELFHAARREHLDALLQRLEGWWFQRVLRQLIDFPSDRISSVEIEARMSDLRDQFKQGNLPIDDDLLQFELDEATEAAHSDSTFVSQLRLIDAGKRRIAAAIRDYYRAFEQRSRWLREDLVAGLDLDKYERRLTEEWELVFDAMVDEIGTDAAEEERAKAARSVLQWAERATVLIRPSVEEPFVCRGSLHMLSDEFKIGWHPDFRGRLSHLLGRPLEAS